MSIFGDKTVDVCPPQRVLPRFCSRCSSPLVLECNWFAYDDMTGVPQYHRWLHCPRWKGGDTKITGPSYGITARWVADDGVSWRWEYLGVYDATYINCAPAYCPPEPAKPKKGGKK